MGVGAPRRRPRGRRLGAGRSVTGSIDAPVPPRTARSALVPLLAYHALIVVGGAILIEGWIHGSGAWMAVGLGILLVGLATVVAVLVWAARLAVDAGRAIPVREVRSPAPAPRGGTICPRCAWSGPGRRVTCPRCGATVVPTFVGTSAAATRDRPGT